MLSYPIVRWRQRPPRTEAEFRTFDQSLEEKISKLNSESHPQKDRRSNCDYNRKMFEIMVVYHVNNGSRGP